MAIYKSIWDRQKGGIPYMKAYPLKTHIQEKRKETRTKEQNKKTKNILKHTKTY